MVHALKAFPARSSICNTYLKSMKLLFAAARSRIESHGEMCEKGRVDIDHLQGFAQRENCL
jgi:hypothetical protein